MHPSADSPTAVWRKSSKSTATGNECVELTAMTGLIAVRDSADPDGPKLAFTSSAWREFMTRVKSGQRLDQTR
ncbi:DUF397 domain-containing protein [Actinomadura sp. NAK00032]|uniref:DUF397 domain-containing protein n=1 Tax=Actinomadura sp. NAK00032 TaxID=2742128 RepID=UPI0015901B58|nr:DUF397 domain-containing protein [Actinomadura sp. NAK00032]QKW32748.1 DUF397 domain-containing protein [Actinomadura sp. NAK00032]